MKRERSQQQIQQEEKKSRTDDLLFYAEIRTPTDTRRRPLVDQRDFLGLNVSNRTYRPLSAGGSETTSKRASYEPSGNLSNDSGAYSKSTSPESLREDTANAINHSSKSSPNKAEDLSGLTAPSSIEKHSATNTSRLSTPQLLINTELEQQCQLDLSGIHSGASTHTPSDVAMEPALQVRSEPTSPSAEGGGERIESSDREATSQTIQAPQPNASYDVATTGQQLASDLAIITIGTAEAEETAVPLLEHSHYICLVYYLASSGLGSRVCVVPLQADLCTALLYTAQICLEWDYKYECSQFHSTLLELAIIK